MFTTSVRGRKPLLLNKKLENLKARIVKLSAQKLNISLKKIISSSASNMNSVQSEKYGLSPDEIEKKKKNYLAKDLEHFLIFTE